MCSRSEFEVLTTDMAGRWREALDEAGCYDFYHLPEFHRLAEMRGEGSAVMPVYREGGCVIAFPLVLREIETAEGIFDATSVSGFAGPVSNQESPDVGVKTRFQQHLQEFLREREVVSAFSRLNPIVRGESLLDGFGETVERGITLVIDLTQPPDVQIARFKPDYRQRIAKLLENGIVCEEVPPAGYLDEFARLHNLTMDRVGADSLYRFDRSYIEYLFREMAEHMHMFACTYEGAIVSLAITPLCCGIIEGYLMAMNDDYKHLSCSRLVYDAIRDWGNGVGARVLHIGGGVGGQMDSLYQFKRGFGPDELAYSTWRCVIDRPTYNELCRDAGVNPETGDNGGFFPAYRTPGVRSKETEGVGV